MPPMKKFDLNIEIDVLTAGSAADVVNAILELLLYQRNQIPFVYKTYKYYVSKWSKEAGAASDDDAVPLQVAGTSTLSTFQLERQRSQARQTKDAISAMRELISRTFDKNNIKSIRFLFGATTFTAKEAYTIHMPCDTISRLHSHSQHRLQPANLNQTLLTLLTNEDLYGIFSQNLCPTNLYLELEMINDCAVSKEPQMNTELMPKDICKLPPSCKDIHFHLLHTRPQSNNAIVLQCCKQIQIYEDILRLNLKTEEDCELNEMHKKNNILPIPDTADWWEAEVIIRGFKEKPIKGHNIWSK